MAPVVAETLTKRQTQPSDAQCSFMNIVYWLEGASQAPSQLNTSAISHIMYSFANVNANGTATLPPSAPVDGQPSTIAALRNLRNNNPHLQVVLSVGGGAASSNFTAVAASPRIRSQFVNSLVSLLQTQSFDGIDIDWEYPLNATDAANYLSLLQLLRSSLAPQFSLSTALGAESWAYQALNLSSVARYVDWINLMAYDFSAYASPRYTGHHAQLYAPPNPINSNAAASGHSAIQYYLNAGVQPWQLVLGAPLYGQKFLQTKGYGKPFNSVQQIAYSSLSSGPDVVNTSVVGAHRSTSDSGWISYDDTKTISIKANYAVNNGLGGMMYWSGDQDSFSWGYSLVSTAFNVMNPQCIGWI